MQFSIGIELSAKAEPGMTTEQITKEYGENTSKLMSGARKNIAQHNLITNT
jgi:hypothetical protein